MQTESRPRRPYHTKSVQAGLEKLAITSTLHDDDCTAARNWIDAIGAWRVSSPDAHPAGRGRSVSERTPGAVLATAPGEEAGA